MADEIEVLLARWEVTPRQVRDRMYGAPTPRERERWHGLWLLAQGWSAAAVARAFERDPHTIGSWLDAFGQRGPTALAFEHTGGPPPPSTPRSKPT